MWKLSLYVLALSCLSSNCQDMPSAQPVLSEPDCTEIKNQLDTLLQNHQASAAGQMLSTQNVEVVLSLANEIKAYLGDSSFQCEDLQAENTRLRQELNISKALNRKCASAVVQTVKKSAARIKKRSLPVAYTKLITEGLHKDKTLPLVQLGGGFYYFEMQHQLDWASSQLLCQQLDLRLVSVETLEENTLLKEYIHHITDSHEFWTSGNDIIQRDQYVWNSTGQPITFFDWGPNEPSHSSYGGVIDQVIHFNQILTWNDKPPSASLFALCEKM